jgi:hypothetical protein
MRFIIEWLVLADNLKESPIIEKEKIIKQLARRRKEGLELLVIS